jgi:hypothetical protein
MARASGTTIDDELELTLLTVRTVGERAPSPGLTGLRGGVSGVVGWVFGFDVFFGRWGCWRTTCRGGVVTRGGVTAAAGGGGGGGGGGTYVRAGGAGGGGGGSGFGRVVVARVAAWDPPANAYVRAKPSRTRPASSASRTRRRDAHHAAVVDRKLEFSFTGAFPGAAKPVDSSIKALGSSRRTQTRCAALPRWLEHYNRRRPHSSLGDRPPLSAFTTSVGSTASRP